MSLFDRCAEVVDQHLGITDDWVGIKPRFKSTTSLLRMTDDNLPDGRELVSNLFGQMMFNWGVGGCPATSSLENWRHQKHTGFQDVKRSPEVPLERTIAALMDEKWANQIPVDSGLLGGGKTLDLACLHGDSIDLIELKVNSNTPLSAAVQVLFYGLAHVFFQLHRERVLPTDSASDLLAAKTIHLRVLAPSAFYERFVSVGSWLHQFESRLNDGLANFSERLTREDDPKIVGFRFDAFPNSFAWNQARHGDTGHREELRSAMIARHSLFQ